MSATRSDSKDLADGLKAVGIHAEKPGWVEKVLNTADDKVASLKARRELLGDFDFGKVLENASNGNVEGFLGPLNSFVSVLEEVAKIHAFVAVVVIPFKALVNLELKRRENDRRILVLVNQMADMMSSLAELLHVKPDQLQSGTLVDILGKVKDDIVECGNAIDLYFKQKLIVKFIKSISWQDKLTAFAEAFAKNKSALHLKLVVIIHQVTTSTHETVSVIDGKMDAVLDMLRTANEAEADADVTHDSKEEKHQKDAVIKLLRRRTVVESKVDKFVNKEGGVERCVGDENLFSQLVSQLEGASNPSAAGAYGTMPPPLASIQQLPYSSPYRAPPYLLPSAPSPYGGYPQPQPWPPYSTSSAYPAPAMSPFPPGVYSPQYAAPSLQSTPGGPTIPPGPYQDPAQTPRAWGAAPVSPYRRSSLNSDAFEPDGRLRSSNLRQHKVLALSALSTELEVMLAKNQSVWMLKFDYQTNELKRHYDDNTDKVLHAIRSGPHERVMDRNIQEIWESEKWRGSVAGVAFVQAVQDYMDEAVQDNQKKLLSETWTLRFLGVSHRAALLEVIDTDHSGFVSVQEVNRFTASKPSDCSLPLWLAYSAVAWSYGAMYYKKQIMSLVEQGMKGAYGNSWSATANEQAVGEYIYLVETEIINSLLLPMNVPPNRIKDVPEHEPLAGLLQTKMDETEDTLRSKLEKANWDIDGEATLQAIAGDGPIEQYLLPLLFVMLQRHTQIVAKSVRGLNHQKLAAARDTIQKVLTLVDDRVMYFRDAFSPSQISTFACGLFSSWIPREPAPESLPQLDVTLHNDGSGGSVPNSSPTSLPRSARSRGSDEWIRGSSPLGRPEEVRTEDIAGDRSSPTLVGLPDSPRWFTPSTPRMEQRLGGAPGVDSDSDSNSNKGMRVESPTSFSPPHRHVTFGNSDVPTIAVEAPSWGEVSESSSHWSSREGRNRSQLGRPQRQPQSQYSDPSHPFDREPTIPYPPFDSFNIVLAMEELMEQLPVLPPLPQLLVPHDVLHNDWSECMKTITEQWVSGSRRRVEKISATVDEWNRKFFLKRGVRLIFTRNRRKPRRHSADETWDSPPEDSSSDEEEGPRRSKRRDILPSYRISVECVPRPVRFRR